MKRPGAVTAVGSILIATSALSLVSAAVLLPRAEVRASIEAQGGTIEFAYRSQISNGAAILVAAIAMLKGYDWGRLLYLLAVPVGMILNALVFGFGRAAFPGLVVYGVFVALLTRPPAEEYFRGRRPAAGTPS